ncbi:MAG: hypothetical protein ACLQHF_08050 [Terracidiphilus sp.]
MQHRRTFLLAASLLAPLVAFSGTNALAATPGFTIAATSVTMSNNASNGVGFSSFTLTSVNGYTGSVRVGCDPPNPPTGVNVPLCGSGSPGVPAQPVQPPITLTANEVVTGTIPFYNAIAPCSPCPVSLPRHGGHGPTSGLALAGALLIGFGFRRWVARGLTLTLLVVGALAGLAGISACGGNKSVVTPGTYAYTIPATDINTAASVNTSINVTVP